MPSIGIIANPASGKDIRRLVSYATTIDNQEKVKIFTQKKQEAAMEEQKLMAPIFKDINLAIRTVAKNKKCTVVVDKAATFFGGLDLTDDVIQEVKKVSAGSN